MAANANGEYKVFKYYEGMCSSGDFTKEIAKVLSLGVRSKEVKDVDGNVIEQPFILRAKNWDIVYPAPDSSLNIDLENMTTAEYEQKILNQISKISDTVILKTKTTPKDLTNEEIDNLTVDSDSNKAYLEMYLEIYKPSYIANPEEYPLDCERQGIIPKLITKKLYQDSLKVNHACEDYIYTDINICQIDKKDDPSNGRIELRYSDCDAYVTKINTLYGDMSFGIPNTDGATNQITINSGYLAKIKQQDAELYELILNNLNGGEGIEPKDYSLLDHLTIEITKIVKEDGVVYAVSFEGITKLTTYSIQKSTTKGFVPSHKPESALMPELYLNGIYTPIDPALYQWDAEKNTLYFLDNYSFEASRDGLLVVRYQYTVKSKSVITERETLLNNHYVLMRLFDNINADNSGPADNVYNSAGEIIQTNSHISPWSKLSWYKDFEEVMIDYIDPDVSISRISDGTIFVPLETPGLNADTKIRYWVNTNNDRFSLIVMGNPSLDYEMERHLTSACYCGRIDSFDNSINDTAGNFALFTSSSTEPCNTVLNTQKITYEMMNYALSKSDIIDETYDMQELENFKNSCLPEAIIPGNNSTKYFIQLPEKTYYSRDKWPKYLFVDTNGKPVTPLTSAFEREFVMDNGKADLLELTVENDHVFDEKYMLYVSFNYYQEKFIITSGVTRDAFGNVVAVDKVKDYGNNTSDGVTSVTMYHTRSKAYYQKHHLLFATTEEYMSKVMYGKSAYTGEYYADRIKITHGNDGPRGTLSDLLIIDNSSLYTQDELVINKDFEKDPDECEETFVFFNVTAYYSPLSDSPNARYGLAIKKQEIEPEYKDEAKILKIALDELGKLAEEAWWPVDKNIVPRDKTSNGCDVYWSIVENSAWMGTPNNLSDYTPIQLAVINTSEYKGDETNPIFPTDGVILEQGTTVGNKTYSFLKISGFTANTGEKILYGIADEPIESLGTNAQIKSVMRDGSLDGSERFEYKIYGVPCTGEVGETLPTTEFGLMDANPNKYLILYSVNETTSTEEEKYNITKFSCVSLKIEGKPDNWLLQYPCTVNAYIESGKGFIVSENMEKDTKLNQTINYGSEFSLALSPATDDDTVYELSKVIVMHNETETTYTSFVDITVNGLAYKGIQIDSVTSDIKIKIQFSVK